MNFKKVLKRTGTFLFAFGLMGTTAFAAEELYTYSFYLNTSQASYTPVYRKATTSSTAYVTRQTPASPITTIEIMVCNSAGVRKSSKEKIVGVGTAYPSYSGYNVDYGDSLCLRVYNPSTDNQGVGINAGGKWRP